MIKYPVSVHEAGGWNETGDGQPKSLCRRRPDLQLSTDLKSPFMRGERTNWKVVTGVYEQYVRDLHLHRATNIKHFCYNVNYSMLM